MILRLWCALAEAGMGRDFDCEIALRSTVNGVLMRPRGFVADGPAWLLVDADDAHRVVEEFVAGREVPYRPATEDEAAVLWRALGEVAVSTSTYLHAVPSRAVVSEVRL